MPSQGISSWLAVLLDTREPAWFGWSAQEDGHQLLNLAVWRQTRKRHEADEHAARLQAEKTAPFVQPFKEQILE
jgi:hypothetical protein